MIGSIAAAGMGLLLVILVPSLMAKVKGPAVESLSGLTPEQVAKHVLTKVPLVDGQVHFLSLHLSINHNFDYALNFLQSAIPMLEYIY